MTAAVSPNTFKTDVLIAPPGATDAVYFCPGQLYHSSLRNSMQTEKPISANTYKLSGAEVEIDTGWLPPHIVRCGEGPKGAVVMSYQPPARRQILVHLKGTQPTKLTLPLPALVLAGVKSNYFIFATKGDDFSPKAQLFFAPLPNVGANAKICFGANQVPTAGPQTLTEVWQLIFESPFNADQSQNKSLAQSEDVRLMLKKVARDKPDVYPLDDLVQFGSYRQTVAEVWEDLTRL